MSNHYPAAIPIRDVQGRLFHWHAESRRLAVERLLGGLLGSSLSSRC